MRQVELVIFGKPPRKSNSRRIVMAGGKPRLIKSAEALRYVRDFLAQIGTVYRVGIGDKDAPLSIEGDIFYPWRFKGDLSGELIMDCLTKAGVISDDRYVVEQIWRKRYDPETPRVELIIREIEKWRW